MHKLVVLAISLLVGQRLALTSSKLLQKEHLSSNQWPAFGGNSNPFLNPAGVDAGFFRPPGLSPGAQDKGNAPSARSEPARSEKQTFPSPEPGSRKAPKWSAGMTNPFQMMDPKWLTEVSNRYDPENGWHVEEGSLVPDEYAAATKQMGEPAVPAVKPKELTAEDFEEKDAVPVPQTKGPVTYVWGRLVTPAPELAAEDFDLPPLDEAELDPLGAAIPDPPEEPAALVKEPAPEEDVELRRELESQAEAETQERLKKQEEEKPALGWSEKTKDLVEKEVPMIR